MRTHHPIVAAAALGLLAAGAHCDKPRDGATSSPRAPAPSTQPPYAASVKSAAPSASAAAAPSSEGVPAAVPTSIALPDGAPGIGFDDLRYAPLLGRLLVPGGRSGNLDLVDPTAFTVAAIGGFPQQATFGGGHDFGVTSADEAEGMILVTDRKTKTLQVIGSISNKVVASVALAASPDYVRYVAATKEAWVTEPDGEQIEIFALDGPMPKSVAKIAVKGGPESIVVDAAKGVAYTHLWKGKTVAIDVKSRKVGPAWDNGCQGSRGIDLDPTRGLLFVGCAEGKVVALDAATGAQKGMVAVGAGVDIIAYDAGRGHVYAPGGTAATLTIVGVGPGGALSALGTSPVAKGSHCVATDGRGRAYVCDPSGGRLIVVTDAFPATGQ